MVNTPLIIYTSTNSIYRLIKNIEIEHWKNPKAEHQEVIQRGGAQLYAFTFNGPSLSMIDLIFLKRLARSK